VASVVLVSLCFLVGFFSVGYVLCSECMVCHNLLSARFYVRSKEFYRFSTKILRSLIDNYNYTEIEDIYIATA
jgi:hypothetical protein